MKKNIKKLLFSSWPGMQTKTWIKCSGSVLMIFQFLLRTRYPWNQFNLVIRISLVSSFLKSNVNILATSAILSIILTIVLVVSQMEKPEQRVASDRKNKLPAPLKKILHLFNLKLPPFRKIASY